MNYVGLVFQLFEFPWLTDYSPLNDFFTLAVGCCYKKENNSQECLCTGTKIDDPDTPGSCCFDDVDNPGNCCKFVYILSFCKILINAVMPEGEKHWGCQQ